MQKRTKLDVKVEKYILIGYDERKKMVEVHGSRDS